MITNKQIQLSQAEVMFLTCKNCEEIAKECAKMTKDAKLINKFVDNADAFHTLANFWKASAEFEKWRREYGGHTYREYLKWVRRGIAGKHSGWLGADLRANQRKGVADSAKGTEKVGSGVALGHFPSKQGV